MSPAARFCFLALASLIAFSTPSFAMPKDGCGGDCSSCHTLSLKEAGSLLHELGAVKSIKTAPVRGLYQITLEREGKTGVVYLDYGKKHLIAGSVFDLARKGTGEEGAHKRAERLDPASLTTDDALVMGNPKGKKRLFVFTDPECPFCARMHVELKKLCALEPDLAVYIKLFPLRMHPHAYDKARVILGERSLALLEKSYAGEALPAPGARDAAQPVDRVLSYAASVGIDSTPTLVLPDGRILPGAKDAEAMRKLLK